MNTYTVTFYDESDADPEDVEIREVRVTSTVEPDELAAGEWDAHSLLVTRARQQDRLDAPDHPWTASHVTLPDGEVVEVPAGL